MTKPKGKIIGDYELKTLCSVCGSFYGVVYENNVHKELRCKGCNRHIKMLSKDEAWNIVEVIEIEDKDDLAEINFKLDLIIDHLGIRV